MFKGQSENLLENNGLGSGRFMFSEDLSARGTSRVDNKADDKTAMQLSKIKTENSSQKKAKRPSATPGAHPLY